MIIRNPSDAVSQQYDVVIIGGGILGVCHLFEAARRGLRALLLERGDFGGATSWASQRIVHGGLRYLQSLDFPRHRTSIRERTWLLKHFPDQVRPLPCLMPLYNRGVKRRSIMRAALSMNDLLSRGRNDGLDPSQIILSGRLLSSGETIRWFSAVEQNGLCGGALWHDGMMIAPQRLLMEWLRWACAMGGTALNYAEATDLELDGRAVRRVRAVDRMNGSEYAFETTRLINTAGPWANETIGRLTGAKAPFVPLSLAFCVLLDRPALSEAALAVSPGQSGRPMYFLTPCQGRIMAGTVHLPWSGPASVSEPLRPTDEQVSRFLDDLNAAVPDLEVRESDVLRVLSGFLPATRPGSGTPSNRTQWIDHAAHGGPRSMLTVTGIKYTTARAVAERTMRMFFPNRAPSLPERPAPRTGLDWSNPEALPRPLSAHARDLIRQLAEEESVMQPDDLLYRRTDWGLVPHHGSRLRHDLPLTKDQSWGHHDCLLSLHRAGINL